MAELRARALFHSLIVVGAALGGCGAKVDRSGQGGNAGQAGVSTAGGGGSGEGGSAGQAGVGTSGTTAQVSPADCESTFQWRCDDYDMETNCRCDVSAPLDEKACDSPFDFKCERPTPYRGVGCRCDPSALDPYDCPHTQQFTCAGGNVVLDDCHCEADAPLSGADCGGNRIFLCAGAEPEWGCWCETGIK